MRLLVCGGRTFDDAVRLWRTLDSLHRVHGFTALIHGTATGADTLAGTWAKQKKIPVLKFRPDWKRYGNRAAGPIRNQKMLDEGKPDLVVAFKGGSGTRDMMKKARAAGVPVVDTEG
jgi:hypothetical protein